LTRGSAGREVKKISLLFSEKEELEKRKTQGKHPLGLSVAVGRRSEAEKGGGGRGEGGLLVHRAAEKEKGKKRGTDGVSIP